MTLKEWNRNKMLLAPVAALGLWVISVLCFVFGLSFNTPLGFSLFGLDIGQVIAFTLSIIMTIVQLMGNGKSLKDMWKSDPVFFVGWMATYVLGVSSNTNALLKLIGIGDTVLEWAVAGSLGLIIEIMPEKLIIRWLKVWEEIPTTKPTQKPAYPVRSQPFNPNLQNKLPKQATHAAPELANRFRNNQPRPMTQHPNPGSFLTMLEESDDFE